MTDFVTWLIEGGVGPALAALPVNWGAEALAGTAKRWFRRFRRTDDLSCLVRAASSTSVGLTRAEFGAVKQLLEDQQTWALAGRGTVEDLAFRIAACLPPRDGRRAEESRAAAMAIARGLLECAVFDLEPQLFQRVLLTRLQRMETAQASAIDEALLELHGDLIARFSSLMEQFKRVLDRMPPGPAQRAEISVYLQSLIDWLSSDPWPRDRRFAGPVLTPAAIERQLRVHTKGQNSEPDLAADTLVQRCQRLVILGGPGSGKTWLAKRTARHSAREALQALSEGRTVDEIELPLFTTCSWLFSATGNIRHAVVSSALDKVADLGGSRITAALHVFFTERNAPTLLVIDSLDEAYGNDERLWQADTLPWRIILTSRPSAWNHQLAIGEGSDSRLVGDLQPLRYPSDVEPFIERWFDKEPQIGRVLIAQIARRANLQQAVTVPLILAFYCIVGADVPLPEFRRDLNVMVLRRMLTGRWRGSDDRTPDVRACLHTLRAWAWSGTATDPISGVGAWPDDIAVERHWPHETGNDALDHIATPLGLPHVDTGKIMRRFIHRSIREHLVAEHVADLPVDQAVETLLPHLWYDPDWEYAAPAAFAMHPQRDQLLRDVICRASGSEHLPADLSAIDAGWELRRLLARVATESSEGDWSPEVAAMIGTARVQLARSGFVGHLGAAGQWWTSNCQVRDAVVDRLADPSLPADWGRTLSVLRMLESFLGVITGLGTSTEDKRHARGALLRLLAGQTGYLFAERAVAALTELDPTTEDKRRAREVLLGMLAGQTDRGGRGTYVAALTQLDPTTTDKRHACSALLRLVQADSSTAEELMAGLVLLDPTAEDKRRAREVLLGLLAGQTDSGEAEKLAAALAQLDPTTTDKRHACSALLRLVQADSSTAEELMAGLVLLDPTAEDKRRAREVLLGLLAGQTDSGEAERLAAGLVPLDPAAEDKRRAREVLLGLLAGQTDIWAAWQVIDTVAQLDPTAEDKRQTRERLLELSGSHADAEAARALVVAVTWLDPTAEDKFRAREVLLGLLAGQTDSRVAWEVISTVAELDPTAEDKRQTCEVLLGLLAQQTREMLARQADSDPISRLLASASGGYPTLKERDRGRRVLLGLMAALIRLDPTPEEKRRAREVLLGLADDPTNHVAAEELAAALATLDPTVADKRRAREVLLRRLANAADDLKASTLVAGLAQLDPSAADKRRALDALFPVLARIGRRSPRVPSALRRRGIKEPARDYGAGRELVTWMPRLATTADDECHARQVLLTLLDRHDSLASTLANMMSELHPTSEDKRSAREVLLRLLAQETSSLSASVLAHSLARLDPTVGDISTWQDWAVTPDRLLLAAVRRNSPISAWLAALRSFPD